MLDDIVNRYNNKVHRTLKMKPIEVISDSYAEYNKILMKKILNLQLAIMSEYQNTKTSLLKDILQIGQKTFLLLVKLKTLFHGLILLVT